MRELLLECPAWMQDEEISPVPGDLPHWSGDAPPPAIGATVKVLNGFGDAQVAGYYVLDGYLGIAALIADPPAWFLKQRKKDGTAPDAPALIFGAEIATDVPMSIPAAVRLAAKLEVGDNYRAEVRGSEIVFMGSPTGEHSLYLEVSSRARVLAHWRGYSTTDAKGRA